MMKGPLWWLGLALLGWACTPAGPDNQAALATLDSLVYTLPALDMPITEAGAEGLMALAKQRLEGLEQPVGYTEDSLTEAMEYHRRRVRAAMVAGDYELGQGEILAYQRAYDRKYVRPMAGGLLMDEFLWAELAEDGVRLPTEEQVGRYLTRVRGGLNDEEEWQLLNQLAWLSAEAATDDFVEMLTALQEGNDLTVNGKQTDDLLASYWRMRVHRGLDSVSDVAREVAIEGKYGITDTIQIPMRDGTMLGGILFLPQNRTGPVPTVLYVNCYPDRFVDELYCRMAASRGYAGLTVYTRGMGLSEGTFEPLEHDVEDNYEIIGWASEQPWSDGQVGMTGGSYLGFTQWAALKNPHPALKTIVPLVAVGPGIDFPKQNGVYMPYMLQWLKYVTNDRQTDYATFSDFDFWFGAYRDWYEEGKAFREFDGYYGTGEGDARFQRWLDHPDYDGYWQGMVPATPEEFAAIDIPILTVTGYYDDDQLGALHYYRMHQRYGQDRVAKEHYLVMGPWSHGGAQSAQGRSVYGEYLPYEASVDVPKLGFDWFDYVMREGSKPDLLKDRVNVWVMEEGWQYHAAVGELADTATWYPQPTEDGWGGLAHGTATGSAMLMEDFAPNGLDSVFFSTILQHDSTFAEALREDNRLVWETEPLAEPMVLSGVPVASLTITPGARDADLLITWYEVKANGEVLRLSRDLERLSYVPDPTTRQLLVPDERMTVRLQKGFWMSRRVAAGSRLRVTVNINSSHEWMKNYGSGKAVAEENEGDYRPMELEFHLEGCAFYWPLAPAEGAD